MRYFFVSPERVFQENLILSGEESHHIRDVLRMDVGETLQVSDGRNFLFRARIAGYENGEALCSILEQSPLPPPPGPRVTLLQSIPKGKRMTWLVQKSTEVGVHELVPIMMQRSVRLVSSDKATHSTDRWRRVSEEAAKQCGRCELPLIQEPLTLDEALKRVENFPLRIFFNENEKEHSLREIRLDYPDPGRIALVVGPEGGTTSEESDLLSSYGFISASLGELVLRVETAGVLSVALVRYEWGMN